MPKFNLKTLDGVMSWSIFTGLMLAVLISTQVDISETAILLTVLETIVNAFGYDTALISLVVIGVTILELIILIQTIRNIEDSHGILGLVILGLGFFGSLILFVGALQEGTFGIFMIIAGYVIIRFVEN